MPDLNFSSANMSAGELWTFAVCVLLLLLALGNMLTAWRANDRRARAGMNGLRRLTTRQDVRRALLKSSGLLLMCAAILVALGSPPPTRIAITVEQAAFLWAILGCAGLLALDTLCDAYDRVRYDAYVAKYRQDERNASDLYGKDQTNAQ